MAKKRRHQNREDLGLWDRISLWIEANEKVFWVSLLAVISFTFAFPSVFDMIGGRPAVVSATIFGEDVTSDELKMLQRDIQVAHGFVPELFYFSMFLNQKEVGMIWAYLREAERIGITVSDAELGAARRRVWRRMKATERAQAAQVAGDPAASPSPYEILQNLEDRNVFDLADWSARVKAQANMTTRAAEEALRSAMIITKLEEHVRSAVTVSDKEVFERYLDEYSKRRGSWVALEASDDLKAKIAASLADDAVETYFEANRERFRKGISVQCDYLIVPQAHFRDQLAASVSDDTLRAEYERTKGAYPRPATSISPRLGAFELLSKEEMEARDEELYLSFDEAKEELREKFIGEQAALDARKAANQIEELLHPATGKSATFADMSTAYPYVEVGHVGPVGRDDAEEAFGDAWVPLVMSGWFSSAETNGDLTSAQRTIIEKKQNLPDDAGFVFFDGVEVLDPHDPELDAVRSEVVDAMVGEKLLELLTAAAEARVAAIDGGETTLDALAGTEIEIEVAAGVMANAVFGALGKTDRFIGRREVIEIPDDESEEADAKKPHPASALIVGEIFAVAEKGKTGSQMDEEGERCFVVTFDDQLEPDAADFDSKKLSVRSSLTREREEQHIQEWLRDLATRAYGVAPPEPVAGAGEGAESAS